MSWTSGGTHRQIEVAAEGSGQSEQGGMNAEEVEKGKSQLDVRLL
jgi:hypothetical protein